MTVPDVEPLRAVVLEPKRHRNFPAGGCGTQCRFENQQLLVPMLICCDTSSCVAANDSTNIAVEKPYYNAYSSNIYGTKV
jgi:hypothetical protein